MATCVPCVAAPDFPPPVPTMYASSHPHGQQVEQVHLPRLRSHGEVARRARTVVHAEDGRAHLQTQLRTRLYNSRAPLSPTSLRVARPPQVPHVHPAVRAARHHVVVQLARLLVRVLRRHVQHAVHVRLVRALQLRLSPRPRAHLPQQLASPTVHHQHHAAGPRHPHHASLAVEALQERHVLDAQPTREPRQVDGNRSFPILVGGQVSEIPEVELLLPGCQQRYFVLSCFHCIDCGVEVTHQNGEGKRLQLVIIAR